MQGQALADHKTDALRVLNGHANIQLNADTYDTMRTGQLIQMYSSTFGTGQVIKASGFRFSENSNLRFYQTSIENHTLNDGGLSTWRLIE